MHTQAEVDAIVSRERASTKAATAAETATALATELGCTVEEAKAYIAAAKTAEEGQLSDAQKAQKKAEADAVTAAAATAAAELAGLQAKITIALVSAGVPVVAVKPEDQAKVDAKLAMLIKLVDVPATADADAIKAAVTLLKETTPELFSGVSATPTIPDTDPLTPNAPSKVQEDAMKRGADRAKTATHQSGYAWETPAPAAST